MNIFSRKTIALVGLVLVAPVAASAEPSIFEGNSGQLQDGCAFIHNYAGDMEYSDDTGEWTVTKPAELKIRARSVRQISVQAGQELLVDGVVVSPADVDFRDPQTLVREGNKTHAATLIEAERVEATGLKDYNYNIELGGTVTSADPDFVTSSNTDYVVMHQVTCVQ